MNTLNICGNNLPVYDWGQAPIGVLECVEVAPDGTKWHMISLPPDGGIMLAKLREKLMQARKAGRADEMSTLQVLIGEVTTLEARNIKINDEECERVIRKVIEADKETLSLMKETESDNAKKLLAEVDYLSALLPKTLSVAEIVEQLASQAEAVKSARNEGQAVGVAMKYFKNNSVKVLGEDVKTAVATMRATHVDVAVN
jgi:hypothetical protein